MAEHERERLARPPSRARAPARVPAAAPALARLASTLGNAQFARLVQPGGGLLPRGGVHPAVEGLIRERAGRGGRLDSGMVRWATDQLVDPAIHDVNMHTDTTADALARSVSARAFTVGNDVFFSAGAYQPQTAGGRHLIAHELTHVSQQRGAATTGPLTVSDPGDALERDADQVAGELDLDG
jgi:hypothetical protein